MSDSNLFDYDFHLLNALDIRKEESSHSEIISVCEGETTRWREIEGFPKHLFYCIAIGYSNKKRILQVACRFINYKIQLLQIKRPDEGEIERYYCKK